MKPTLGYKQRGATLITALVMLVVLTLLVISAIRSSSTNLRIAGNMQMQAEVIAAAQQASEQVLSSNFTKNPVAVDVLVDINNDGTTDYTAQVAPPVCTGSTALQNSTPNLPPQCISSSTAQNTGIVFTSGVVITGTSWCAAQQWDVRTQVSDSVGGANATMHQGVSLTVEAGTPCVVALPAP